MAKASKGYAKMGGKKGGPVVPGQNAKPPGCNHPPDGTMNGLKAGVKKTSKGKMC